MRWKTQHCQPSEETISIAFATSASPHPASKFSSCGHSLHCDGIQKSIFDSTSRFLISTAYATTVLYSFHITDRTYIADSVTFYPSCAPYLYARTKRHADVPSSKKRWPKARLLFSSTTQRTSHQRFYSIQRSLTRLTGLLAPNIALNIFRDLLRSALINCQGRHSFRLHLIILFDQLFHPLIASIYSRKALSRVGRFYALLIASLTICCSRRITHIYPPKALKSENYSAISGTWSIAANCVAI